MTTTATSSKLITTLEDLQSMVAIVRGGFTRGAKSDQTITFAQVGTEKEAGKLFIYGRVNFKYMAVECDGPETPYVKKVGAMELGPKRPQIKIILSPNQMEYEFQTTLDQTVRAGYEFSKTKLREAFPELVTFAYQGVTVAPSRTTPLGKIGYEVLVVLQNGTMVSLSEFLPANLNEAQTEAISQIEKDKRLIETECVEGERKYKTFIFANLEPKIDPKSKKIFQEMHINHSSYPEGIRHYRSAEHPYRPSMADIHQWGIVIPRMVQNAHGGYNFDPSSDWVKEPGFKAVTKAGERNPFIGRVGFTVDSIMEGAGHIKVWYRCQVWLMPQKSNAAGDDFGEEALVPSTAPVVSLSPQSKAASASPGSPGAAAAALDGTMEFGDPNSV